MQNKYILLPFYFRYINNINKYILSNINGNYCIIDNISILQNIVEENFNNLSPTLIDTLLINNIISEKEEINSKTNILITNYASSINSILYSSMLILIIPTLRCDHDCSYCQVSRVSENSMKHDAHIKDIKKIITQLKQLKKKSLKIEFQGGEPLLYTQYIKEFYQLAILELGEETSFVICSALGPLKSDFLEWTKNKKITFSTSLDGDEEVHTKNRSSQRFNSYEKTKKGIHLIQTQLGKDKVNALATITKATMKRPKKLIDTYIKNNFTSIFLRPISPLGFAYKHSNMIYTAEDFLVFYKECMDYIFHINKSKLFIEETAAIYLKKILYPSQSSYVDLQSPSGFLLNALVFNYDGNLFGSDEARMLYEMTKNEELIAGNIHDNIINPVNRNNTSLLADSFLSCTPGCDECTYQAFCGSDIAYHLSTQGDHIGNKALSDYCKLQRLLFDYFIEILEDKNKRKIIESWLM